MDRTEKATREKFYGPSDKSSARLKNVNRLKKCEP